MSNVKKISVCDAFGTFPTPFPPSYMDEINLYAVEYFVKTDFFWLMSIRIFL